MRTSKRHQRLLREFERSDSLLASDRGKIVEKLLQRVARLQVVDEIFEWHTRPRENYGSPLDLGI